MLKLITLTLIFLSFPNILHAGGLSTLKSETEFIATAYCACVKCCGKSDGITASGRKAVAGRTIACNWLPFGTRLEVNGKVYIVEDRGARSIFGHKNNRIKRLDIYMSSHKEALVWGKRRVSVKSA